MPSAVLIWNCQQHFTQLLRSLLKLTTYTDSLSQCFSDLEKNGASKTLCLQNQIYSMFSFTPWVKILYYKELSHSQKSECKDTVTNIFIKMENQAVKSVPSQDNLTKYYILFKLPLVWDKSTQTASQPILISLEPSIILVINKQLVNCPFSSFWTFY